jgi:hypothetical protein
MSFIPAQSRPPKPLYFPITRHMSTGKQVLSVLLYSLLMVALSAPIFLYSTVDTLDRPSNATFINLDGTVDGLLILAVIAFFLLAVPALALLTGAFFGAVRAFLVACISEGATAAIVVAYFHAHDLIFQPNPVNIIFLMLPPITATLVGLFYDRRRYAAWWLSFLIMLSGAAFFVTGLVVISIIASDPFNEATFGPANPAALAIVLVILVVCMAAIIALLMGGIEGITHSIIASRWKQNRRDYLA